MKRPGGCCFLCPLLLDRFDVLAGRAMEDVNVGQVGEVRDGSHVRHRGVAVRAEGGIRVRFRHRSGM
jgi:hypothetical protein